MLFILKQSIRIFLISGLFFVSAQAKTELNTDLNTQLSAQSNLKSEFGEYTDSLIKSNNKVLAFRAITNEYSKNKNFEMLKKIHTYCTKNDMISQWGSYLSTELSSEPYNPDLNYFKALVHIEQNNSEQAEGLAKLIYQTSAKKDLAFEVLFNIYALRNDSEKVTQILTQLIDLNPNMHSLYFDRATFYLKAGQSKKAQADLINYSAKVKTSEKAYVLQNEIYAFEHQDIKVKENLKNCLSTFSESNFCFSNYLKVQSEKRNAFAIEHYEKNKASFQANSEILLAIGRQYESFNQLSKAEATYLTLSNLDKDQFELLRPLLGLFESTGKHNVSFTKANEFINSHPKHEEAQNYVKSFLNSDNFKINVSNEVSNSVVKNNSAGPESNTAKQNYYSQNFQYLINNKEKLETKNPNYFFRLGNVYFKNSQPDLAVKAWLKASPASTMFEASQINALITLGQTEFKTKSLKILNENKFTNITADQIKTIKELIAVQKSREPANSDYKTKVTEPLLKFMNLDWE